MADEEELVDVDQLANTVQQVNEELSQEPEPEPDPQNPLSQFPPEILESVDGLTWLGYLEDHFDRYGHSFTIRTLRGDEELLAAMLCKEWGNTLGQAKAWIWAQLALAIVSIDGDSNWCPAIGPDKKAHARAKFKYIVEHWYWGTADYIYGRYTELLNKQIEAFEALENL